MHEHIHCVLTRHWRHKPGHVNKKASQKHTQKWICYEQRG